MILQKLKDICKKNGLNISIMRDIIDLKSKCLKNIEIAKELNLTRLTISRYVKVYRNALTLNHEDIKRYSNENVNLVCN